MASTRLVSCPSCTSPIPGWNIDHSSATRTISYCGRCDHNFCYACSASAVDIRQHQETSPCRGTLFYHLNLNEDQIDQMTPAQLFDAFFDSPYQLKNLLGHPDITTINSIRAVLTGSLQYHFNHLLVRAGIVQG
jgi:hypothetical protein